MSGRMCSSHIGEHSLSGKILSDMILLNLVIASILQLCRILVPCFSREQCCVVLMCSQSSALGNVFLHKYPLLPGLYQ